LSRLQDDLTSVALICEYCVFFAFLFLFFAFAKNAAMCCTKRNRAISDAF